MCTAICDGHLCGRTLDNEHSYGEGVVFLPDNLEINLKVRIKVVNIPFKIIEKAHLTYKI